METIYQLALQSKIIAEEKIGITKAIIPRGKLVFTDYTVEGANEEYLSTIEKLRIVLENKYPMIASELRFHLERYDDEQIIHYTAMKSIINCVLALEKGRGFKKIFISHSSKDKELIKRFVDSILQLGVGLSEQDIFCTSIEEMGVKNGDDIRQHIKKNIQSADFSFLMISKYYKESEICLNEMGAVWAVDNRVRYYLLPDVDFKDIGWLCDVKKADLLCNPVVLDTLEEELTGFYGLPHRGVSWSRQRQGFLEYVNQPKE